MKISVIIITVTLLLMTCGGDESASKDKIAALQPFDHGYELYADILGNFVKNGLVDYGGLKFNKDKLEGLVYNIGTADLTAATRDQRLAFFINSYNILTIKAVVDAYPVKSIRDIDGVWDKKKWRVAGERLTLNEIENEILRKEFSEPRIHVAINCASLSCPPLPSRPYYPDSLESQLAEVSYNFARSKNYNKIDIENGQAELSVIFDWFGGDFIEKYYNPDYFKHLEKKENAALNFLISQLEEKEQENWRNTDFRVSYLEYDWGLNELKE